MQEAMLAQAIDIVLLIHSNRPVDRSVPVAIMLLSSSMAEDKYDWSMNLRKGGGYIQIRGGKINKKEFKERGDEGND